jgi:LytS/YehU family sensor histidine kinase
VSGIGIDNVKRRLELLYPGKHHLGIDDGIEAFNVKLELYYGK